MQKYRDARHGIKEAIIAKFKADAKGVTDPSGMEIFFEASAEQQLAEFERLSDKRKEPSWWYGVGQSVAGSFLVFVVLGIAALAILGSRQDPRDLAGGKVNGGSPSPNTMPHPSDRPAAAPTPATHDLSNQPDAP